MYKKITLMCCLITLISINCFGAPSKKYEATVGKTKLIEPLQIVVDFIKMTQESKLSEAESLCRPAFLKEKMDMMKYTENGFLAYTETLKSIDLSKPFKMRETKEKNNYYSYIIRFVTKDGSSSRQKFDITKKDNWKMDISFGSIYPNIYKDQEEMKKDFIHAEFVGWDDKLNTPLVKITNKTDKDINTVMGGFRVTGKYDYSLYSTGYTHKLTKDDLFLGKAKSKVIRPLTMLKDRKEILDIVKKELTSLNVSFNAREIVYMDQTKEIK